VASHPPKSKIDEWKTKFDIESQDDLESTLTDDGLSSESAHDRNTILGRWEQYEDNKRLLKHALELYDDVGSLDPGQDRSSDSSK
jgi:hypothetical protein